MENSELLGEYFSGNYFLLRTSLIAGYVAPIKPDLACHWYCHRFVYMFIIKIRRQHCYCLMPILLYEYIYT
jgi:hypothetical protein